MVLLSWDVVDGGVGQGGVGGGHQLEVAAASTVSRGTCHLVTYCSMHFSNRCTALNPRMEKITAQA